MTSQLKYLFLDLDGTLIQFNPQIFISKYLSLIQVCFFGYQYAMSVPQWILDGTESMLSNDGSMTNKDKFIKYFKNKSGMSEEKIWEIFTQFYKTDFNKLKEITKPVKGAKKFLEMAHKKGYQLVVATQPIFPEMAIRTRLQWAGVDHIPFLLITHIENMHACKPNVLYFKQILDKINASPEQCLMIGNDFQMDMASMDAGIQAYYLNADGNPPLNIRTDLHGNFKMLAKVLEKFK